MMVSGTETLFDIVVERGDSRWPTDAMGGGVFSLMNRRQMPVLFDHHNYPRECVERLGHNIKENSGAVA